MSFQTRLVYLLLLLHFVAAMGTRRKRGPLKNLKWTKPTQLKNNRSRDQTQKVRSNNPIEYLKTPNFNVMLLNEDKSNPMWRKYSHLFSPNEFRNSPQIEVKYESHTVRLAANPRHRFFMKLNRFEVESLLATLGDKKHIIVLYPRDCKSHSSVREFANEFLPKLLQQLQKRSAGECDVNMGDPILDYILAMLNREDQEMLEDLSQKFEALPLPFPEDTPELCSWNSRRKPSGISISAQKEVQPPTAIEHLLFRNPCNEGYVFFVQNKPNVSDPSSLNEVLLRVLKVITEQK